MNTTVVLIGGSHDGERIKHPRYKRIQIRAKSNIDYKFSYATGMDFESFSVEIYESHLFKAGECEWDVFVIQGLPIETAFQRLLDGYLTFTETQQPTEKAE